MKRLLRRRYPIAICVGLAVCFVVWRLAGTDDTESLFTKARDLRVDYILTPERAARLPRPLGSEFDVEATGNVVIQGGEKLLELEADSDGLVVGEFADAAPDSFAFDRGTTLLAITGQYFGQLEDNGAFSTGVPLPVAGMKLAPSVSGGAVYLFGGTGATDRRVYAIGEDGQLAVIAEVADSVVDVADSRDAVYIATAREVLKLTQNKTDLVIRLPEEVGAIASIAVSPDDRTLFFSTGDRVYAMQGLAALAIVKDAGGRLRLRDGALYLWDAGRTLLAKFPQVQDTLYEAEDEPL